MGLLINPAITPYLTPTGYSLFLRVQVREVPHPPRRNKGQPFFGRLLGWPRPKPIQSHQEPVSHPVLQVRALIQPSLSTVRPRVPPKQVIFHPTRSVIIYLAMFNAGTF